MTCFESLSSPASVFSCLAVRHYNEHLNISSILGNVTRHGWEVGQINSNTSESNHAGKQSFSAQHRKPRLNLARANKCVAGGDPRGNGWKQIEWLICIAVSVALCISRRQVYLFSTESLLHGTPLAASESHPFPHLNTQWNHLSTSPGINNSTLVAGWVWSHRWRTGSRLKTARVGEHSRVQHRSSALGGYTANEQLMEEEEILGLKKELNHVCYALTLIIILSIVHASAPRPLYWQTPVIIKSSNASLLTHYLKLQLNIYMYSNITDLLITFTWMSSYSESGVIKWRHCGVCWS